MELDIVHKLKDDAPRRVSREDRDVVTMQLRQSLYALVSYSLIFKFMFNVHLSQSHCSRLSSARPRSTVPGTRIHFVVRTTTSTCERLKEASSRNT